jgi:hypothetical protein
MNLDKGINDIPLSICSQIVNFIFVLQSSNKKINIDILNNHFKKTKSYLLSAINLLRLLEIVELKDEYLIIPNSHLKEFHDNEKKINTTIIDKIITLNPFVQYCTFLNKDKTNLESAKLVCRVFDITKKPEVVQKIFDKWIKLGGITILKGRYESLNLQFNKAQKNTLESRIFLNDILGENYHAINSASIEDFVEAIVEFKLDPKKALNDCGRGLEDFLRIDFAKGVDLSKSNGVGQISTQIFSQKLINAKQNNIITALASIRTMGDAHGVDKNSTERWAINSESALATIILTLETINSIIAYKNNQSLIF